MVWNQVEKFSFSNVAADQAPFTLRGGNYGIEVVGTGFGTVDLKRLAADGSTYLSVLSAAFAANGYQNLNLPSGTYKLTVATATAVYADIVSTVTTQ